MIFRQAGTILAAHMTRIGGKPAMLRNGHESFGLVTILFHWVIVVLFIGQMLLGVAG
jgi:hypothetical protein